MPNKKCLSRGRPRVTRIIVGCGIVLLLACSAVDDDQRYFPLAPGHSWQYRVQRTTMDGTVEMRQALSNVSPPRGSDEISAVQETLSGSRILYSAEATGIYRVGEHRRGDPPPQAPYQRNIVLPEDLEPGQSWTATRTTQVLENTGPPWETLFRVTVPVEVQYVVESLSGEITTPAGHFEDCLIVAGSGRTNADVGNYIGHTTIEITSRRWFAPGVGLVRLELAEKTAAEALNQGSMVMELDNWNHR